MKLLQEKILPPPTESFYVHEVMGPVIDCVFHVHPEYELVYVVSSYGTRFVGDNISNFAAGNLALIGPMLPHHYYNSPKDSLSPHWGHVKLLQFREDFAGSKLFFNIPEMAEIKSLLENAIYGIEFKNEKVAKSVDLLNKLAKAKGSRRIALFIELLTALSQCEYVKLSTVPAVNDINMANDHRMDKILRFIHKKIESGEHLSLTQIAEFTGMTKEAFSRFFKRACLKGFSAYVTELRIGKACNMLWQTQKGISEICYICGFNNLSNFNRHFKKIKGLSPKDYRQKIHWAQ